MGLLDHIAILDLVFWGISILFSTVAAPTYIRIIYLCNRMREIWTGKEATGRGAAAAKLLQSCPTLCDPHRRKPTRLLHPWDSPGKNTGVGCHFLLQCMKVKSQRDRRKYGKLGKRMKTAGLKRVVKKLVWWDGQRIWWIKIKKYDIIIYYFSIYFNLFNDHSLAPSQALF